MGNKLLVRTYNVGVGDCIFVQIPNGDDSFNILIDCGTIGRIKLLEDAIACLKTELPEGDEPGKKRLDLIVATHRHRDHIKGFDPKLFDDIQIKNIWLSAVMNKNHKQAERSHNLNSFTTSAMREIEKLGISLSSQLETLVSLYSVDNDSAMDALREVWPNKYGIEAKYVHAGMTSKSDYLKLPLEDAVIRVLAPENDIDGYYLGEEADEDLRGFLAARKTIINQANSLNDFKPQNITESDFQLLQSRMLSNAFAFGEKDSSIQNNTSIVLLIEWRNRRLLFTGDAEWEGKYKEGKHNGSWNVMWKKRFNYLTDPIDFIKVGHHGSVNATPWNDQNPDHEIRKILSAILPLPEEDTKPTAQALVSTLRTSSFETIPSSTLLVELGKRVENTRRYRSALEDKGFDLTTLPFPDYEDLNLLRNPQPWRTDLEKVLTGKDFTEVWIEP